MSEEPDKSVALLPENAYLIVNSRVFPLDQETVNIGRSLENHLVLNDSSVSRKHAKLAAVAGHFVITDLNSMNGTRVNGWPVQQQVLQSGDILSFGEMTTLYVEYATELLLKALDRTGFPMMGGK